MKLKMQKGSVARKTTPLKAVKKTSLVPMRVIKAKVVGISPPRKPALPGKAAVLAALKKKQRAEQDRLANLTLTSASKTLSVTAADSSKTETAENIVQMPETAEAEAPEAEEPTQEALAKEAEVRPVSMDEIRQAYDGDTAYQLYLKEIGQTALLTIPEENYLAARIKKGDKAARERMIKANLRLVVKIARDYEGYGVPLLDLISEGNIGLMKGVERFDPTKGAKLSTYSAWWIKQAIKRALANQGKTIRLPVHVVDKLFHIRRRKHDCRRLLAAKRPMTRSPQSWTRLRTRYVSCGPLRSAPLRLKHRSATIAITASLTWSPTRMPRTPTMNSKAKRTPRCSARS